jgi:flagellar hook-basal body complex protein FliE
MITNILSPDKAIGDFVNMRTTHPGHLSGMAKPVGSEPSKNFADLLMAGINDVNDKQQNFSDLSLKAVTDPASVDAHDLTIAMAEATMSLNIAKNVIDRVLRAYQTISTLR